MSSGKYTVNIYYNVLICHSATQRNMARYLGTTDLTILIQTVIFGLTSIPASIPLWPSLNMHDAGGTFLLLFFDHLLATYFVLLMSFMKYLISTVSTLS